MLITTLMKTMTAERLIKKMCSENSIDIEDFKENPSIKNFVYDNYDRYLIEVKNRTSDYQFVISYFGLRDKQLLTEINIPHDRDDLLYELGFKEPSIVKVSHSPSGAPLRFVDYSVIAKYKDHTVTTKFDTYNEALNYAQNKMHDDANIIKCYIEENLAREVSVLKRT